MGTNMSISTKIKSMREACGLTQAQMPALLGIPLGTWRNFEQKDVGPSFLHLQQIAAEEQFFRFLLWLVADRVCPECGQIDVDMMMEVKRHKMAALVSGGRSYDPNEIVVTDADILDYFRSKSSVASDVSHPFQGFIDDIAGVCDRHRSQGR
uniref:Uncharacterized protein n=1 Tax=Candidatus Kentrum sp. FM TaxID=2126340 RepID=A0A450S7G7_9GAMM|nr:MAG: hypothetical protein BECKFM1743A_GA0114220_1004718 [Candidatus Kentron sp. FM]VFJ47825.1 MAG: hypothetical protein BECKFM1743C_GA0114222_100513 [Candidatus Kentron sp. FM]VFK07870.1 MAG: hypothetical protein BECKFM1743B_GA0114221_1005217 [Candidatus Kentron sp. FM]